VNPEPENNMPQSRRTAHFVDAATAIIGIVPLVLLMFTNKIPEPIAILAAGGIEVLVHGKVG
jgi:hypothetical protein